jgi:hypothetical protein
VTSDTTIEEPIVILEDRRVFDKAEACGALKTAVRPGVAGWYWCRLPQHTAAGVVYVVPPLGQNGSVYTLYGHMPFDGSEYDHDEVIWFGPIQPPTVGDFRK